jgi:hypothetical protein
MQWGKTYLLYVIILSVITATARAAVPSCDSQGNPTRNPVSSKVYERCESSTSFANRSGCVKGWDKDNYKWDVRATGSDIHASACQNLRIICIDAENRRAHIGCEGGDPTASSTSIEAWVNVDNLSCVQGNVAAYADPILPLVTKPDMSCSNNRSNALPINLDTININASPSYALSKCILGKAYKMYSKVQQQTQYDDSDLLSRYYDGLSNDLFQRSLERALETLSERKQRATLIFGPDCRTSDPIARLLGVSALESIVVEGQRTCRAISAAEEKLQEIKRSGMSALQFAGSLKKSSVVANNDDLAIRTIMFEGLPDSERTEVAKKLHGKRDANEFYFLEKTLNLRPGKRFVALNNMYTFRRDRPTPGRESGIDCSTTIAKLYDLRRKTDDGQDLIPTTKDLQEIARFHAGEGPRPHGDWKDYTSCFESVNLRDGELPNPGDIVVRRVNGEGHVVLIDSFDPKTNIANTIEAAGGAFNTLGPNQRPLFETSCNNPENVIDKPPVRSDVYVMRFVGGKGCPAHPQEDCN